MQKTIANYQLDLDEIQKIEMLIKQLQTDFCTVEDEKFVDTATILAAELPRGFRKLLNDFRNGRLPDGYLLLQGFKIDDEAIGPTPKHWDTPWIKPSVLREEMFQCLVSAGLGDLFGWRTQENGRYLRNIVPIEKDKNEQLGGSSNVVLLWHVEEAFHPQKADMMSIMCYRNKEKACTNICSLNDMEVPDEYWKVLSQPRFFIEPDKSHLPENNQSGQWELTDEHFRKIRHFFANPEPVAVFNGKKGQAELLIDEAFMSAQEGDVEAAEALKWLFQHMSERKHEIVMEPGDLLLIDNRVTGHGRSVYKPIYGDKARWLRRVNITADLRKSYQWKETPYARVIL